MAKISVSKTDVPCSNQGTPAMFILRSSKGRNTGSEPVNKRSSRFLRANMWVVAKW